MEPRIVQGLETSPMVRSRFPGIIPKKREAPESTAPASTSGKRLCLTNNHQSALSAVEGADVETKSIVTRILDEIEASLSQHTIESSGGGPNTPPDDGLVEYSINDLSTLLSKRRVPFKYEIQKHWLEGFTATLKVGTDLVFHETTQYPDKPAAFEAVGMQAYTAITGIQVKAKQKGQRPPKASLFNGPNYPRMLNRRLLIPNTILQV
jgi:hypothetical protein